MTQEEKAKRYDDILVKLQEAKADNNVCDERYCCVIDDIVPELAESEDEKVVNAIRKALESKIEDLGNGVTKTACLAWLEKQKTSEEALQYLRENHSPSEVNDFQTAMNIAVAKAYDKGYNDALEKQGEQKPAEEYNITGISSNKSQGKLGEIIKKIKHSWSEKYIANVFEKVGLAKIVREQSNDNLTNALQDAMMELSKFTPQPKQELSEKDENLFKCAIDAVKQESKVRTDGCLDEEVGEKVINWLKSLKERYTWKPSGEQMEFVWKYAEQNNYDGKVFTRLYNDLKKLKEE